MSIRKNYARIVVHFLEGPLGIGEIFFVNVALHSEVIIVVNEMLEEADRRVPKTVFKVHFIGVDVKRVRDVGGWRNAGKKRDNKFINICELSFGKSFMRVLQSSVKRINLKVNQSKNILRAFLI